MSHINRRKTLTALLLAAGNLLFTNAWAQQRAEEAKGHSHSEMNDADQRLISAVVDTLLPASGEVGGISAGVDKVVIASVVDCLTPQQQSSIQRGLQQLDRLARNNYQRSFLQCKLTERERILLMLKASSDKDDQQFFSYMLSHAMQASAISGQTTKVTPCLN